MAQTAEQYYSNEDLYGSYQYVSLKDIIDGMLFEFKNDSDHYLKDTDRVALLRYAKNAIREINAVAANDIMRFEITVPTTLQWPLPQDYVDYCAIYVNIFDPLTSSWRLEALILTGI
jgi:hypothetical protein